jgi:hypothetical protein
MVNGKRKIIKLKYMKNFLTFIFLTATVSLYAQQAKATKTEMADTTKIVTLLTKFKESKMACKDGYLIDGYIVNISFDKAKMLDGKKIKVTGKYTIVKGLENQQKEYDKNGNEIYMQGRLNDSKHIESPTIDIIKK